MRGTMGGVRCKHFKPVRFTNCSHDKYNPGTQPISQHNALSSDLTYSIAVSNVSMKGAFYETKGQGFVHLNVGDRPLPLLVAFSLKYQPNNSGIFAVRFYK